MKKHIKQFHPTEFTDLIETGKVNLNDFKVEDNYACKTKDPVLPVKAKNQKEEEDPDQIEEDDQE